MSPQTKKLLEEFAARANWGTPGLPSDMERFWDFVISAYRNGEYDIPLDDFLDIVSVQTEDGDQTRDLKAEKQKLSAKMFIFNKYEDGIQLLRRFEGK